MNAVKLSRREFAKGLAGIGAITSSARGTALSASAGSMSNRIANKSSAPTKAIDQPAESNGRPHNPNMIWACLIHLSYNMWADREAPEWHQEYLSAKPYLRFNMEVWNEMLNKMVTAGMNMVIIDLGDGVRYTSHPEIAVRNAWSVNQLRDQLVKLRHMGLEPIPKLNFSTAHDTWLGPYSRCVSTDTYYRVCTDLISEVIQIFEKPRFFHLGMDEETAASQRYYAHVVVRQYDLWWHDFNFLTGEVEKRGVRPWVWSDYFWRHPDVFLKNMPKSVLQSNWYYGTDFDEENKRVKAYLDLDAHGYEQVPTASNWSTPDSFSRTVAYCEKHVASERLLGFLQTTWKPTIRARRLRLLEAVDLVGQVISAHQAQKPL